MINAVFFDLDGTLADTAPDLAWSLNELLAEKNKPALSYEIIRPVVSHGGNAMIKLGFGLNENEPGFSELRGRFLHIYQSRLHNGTQLFPGMPEVLDTLEQQSIIWGVITNKPGWLTNPLMEKLDLKHRAACVVSGDSTRERKPHPAPMYLACEISGSNPATSVYVGDAERDIQAGRASGMHTLVALYGYIDSHEKPEQWNADAMVSSPADILTWLRNHSS